MHYEDVLPAIRVGRLARRASWAEGRCIGGVESQVRAKKVTHLIEYYQYHTHGHSKSWYDLQTANDLLAEDWELIPEVTPHDGVYVNVLGALSSVALHYKVIQPLVHPPEDHYKKNLSSFVHEAMEAYKTESVKALLGALAVGIGALITLQQVKRDDETR